MKRICFPNGNVLFLSLLSISKNRMHNVVWGCAEILPIFIVCNLIDNSSQPMSEQEFLQLLGKKRKWKCVTYLWSSISYQLSKGQSKCVDLHWMEILLHCFYLRILTDLIFPFTFRMQARQTSEGHIVNCLFSCTLIRTKNLTLRLNSGRWIKDRNLLFRSKVT